MLGVDTASVTDGSSKLPFLEGRFWCDSPRVSAVAAVSVVLNGLTALESSLRAIN